MWQIEHETTADVSPERVWRLWSDVSSWKQWNPDVHGCTIDGDFAAGSTVRMILGDGTEVALTLADVSNGRSFTDRAELDGVVVTTEHTMSAVPGGQRISYRLEVDGTAPDDVLEEVGRAVSADWPDTLAGLVATAAR
jgi:uncharacterized protein YndB with AHSA1/START domain